ncbi:hypothetical protein ABIF65_006612 [Bradyrhizobium japonicum]|uniref:DUF6894 family protein n=1 Tax=Bradyrhizobium TaxID=374 RepID=UPI0012FD3051|nr:MULTISPECIES: hypothetical protein [Bradyrhizobium]MCP1783243.1 hypothetical protein [Bradyrhizobium japonicum]MBR0883754.1 hypothetical protein [Bradyrhizobium liaoningense]MBR0947843.1 hypothetical protein [Bradyrhizobium liaoningense]MBR1003837.1 hypothetical protein [Bradyrhizobium liaoningense]MBR1032718.1 hypothetical protein [Bradyrhizobium liaoningense]
MLNSGASAVLSPRGDNYGRWNWQENCNLPRMPKFHFKLVDTRIVADHGVHDLVDETAAQIEAIRLARSLRATRPERVGRNCSVSVVDEQGKSICIIPVDSI